MFISRQSSILFLFMLASSVYLHAQNTNMRTISIIHDDSSYQQAIDQAVDEPFYLHEITYESDVYLQKEEFDYLTGLSGGTTVSAQELKKAVSYLLKKDKFCKIDMQLHQRGDTVIVHFKLLGFWTLARVKIHGVLLGKDRYKNFYLIEPGQRFNPEKHAESMRKITQAFRHDGFFDAHIKSNFVYDKDNKTIEVHINLRGNNQYKIGSIKTVVRKGSCLSDREVAVLKRSCEKRFFKKMRRLAYDKNKINRKARAIKQYLFKQGFVHVTLEMHEKINRENKVVDCTFILGVHKKKKLVFFGNTFFTDDQLLEAVAPFGQSLWFLSADFIKNEIENCYQKKGFLDIYVDVREENDRCFFLIKEGVRAKIIGVELRNVSAYDSQELCEKYFSKIVRNNTFDHDEFAQAVDQLLLHYTDDGYFDAQLQDQSFAVVGPAACYVAILTLNEGSRSFLSTVHVKGYPALANQLPYNSKEEKDIPFDTNILKEQKKWLKDYFRLEKKIVIHAKPTIERNGTAVCVVWEITGDQVATFGKTVIVGNGSFPFSCIKRELQWQEGDPWDQEKLKKTVFRLQDLGVFESIHLYPYDRKKETGNKSVLLKLQPDDRYELRIRAGFAALQVNKALQSGGFTYRLGSAFFVKNPFNRGDQFCLQAEVSQSTRDIRAKYCIPWLFGAPIKTVFQGYSVRQDHPGLVVPIRNLYTVTQQGFLVDMTGISDHAIYGMNVGFEFLKTALCDSFCPQTSCSFVHNLANAINFEPRLVEKNIPYLLLEPTLLLDFSGKTKPQELGMFTLLSCKGMFPLYASVASTYFIRILFEQSFFVPFKCFLCALRVRLGHIFNQELRGIVPIERFYLGGANSLRSYDTDRCPPLGIFVDNCGKQQCVPQGGRSMANINVELRFPLYKQLYGVLFQDLGWLRGDPGRSAIVQSPVAATGFGVRYETPLGSVRFDFGWKWHRACATDPRYAWFLTLGQAF